MLSSFRRSTSRWGVRGIHTDRNAIPRRAIRWACLTTVPLALAACAQLLDLSEPSETRSRLSPTAAETAERDVPFPNLASVPSEPPPVESPEARREIMEGLVADRANAKYTDEDLTAGRTARSRPAAPLPEIFSITPGIGSGSQAMAVAQPEEPVAAPQPGAASEERPPEAASETTQDVAEVPPSPVPELLQPPAETPADGSAGRAVDAEPEAPALEPGGALGPVFEEEPVGEPEAEVAAVPPDAGAPGDREGADTAAGGARILFDEGSAELSAAAQSELAAVAERLARNQQARVELIAYAAGASGEGSSYARRLSLSRAIAVRRFLIEQGVSSSRMDVRALGDQAAEGMPADRVDVTLAVR